MEGGSAATRNVDAGHDAVDSGSPFLTVTDDTTGSSSGLSKVKKALRESLPKRQRAKSTSSALTSLFKTTSSKGRKSEDSEKLPQKFKASVHPVNSDLACPTIHIRDATDNHHQHHQHHQHHCNGGGDAFRSAETGSAGLAAKAPTAWKAQGGGAADSNAPEAWSSPGRVLRCRSMLTQRLSDVPPEESKPFSMFRIALFGAGVWGTTKLRIMHNARLDVVSIFSRTKAGAQRACTEIYGTDSLQRTTCATITTTTTTTTTTTNNKTAASPVIHTNIDNMLGQDTINLVVIATPPQHHVYIAEQALMRGKNVLICGTPALHEEETAKLLSKQREDTFVMFDWGLRFHPAFIKMRRLVSEGYCGDLQVLHAKIEMGSLINTGKYSWVCDEMLGGGALCGLGIHVIDILHFITGLKAQYVTGSLHTFLLETDAVKGYRKITSDDYCTLHLTFKNHAIGTIILNTRSSGFSQEISVYGSEGRLEVTSTLDRDSGTTLVGHRQGDHGETVLFKEAPQADMNPHIIGTKCMYNRMKLASESGENNSCAALDGEAASLSDGHYVQCVIGAAKRSSKTRVAAKVEYDLQVQ